MKRLKQLRESKNLSQQAFAEFFHITQQSVYKYEHGLANPDIEMISQMADFFDTSIDYLNRPKESGAGGNSPSAAFYLFIFTINSFSDKSDMLPAMICSSK